MSATDLARVDHWIRETGGDRCALIPLLQAIQREFKYLPVEALRRICDTTQITPADIEGVATFFPQFRRTPAGEHIIDVCDGTACHVKGAEAVYDALLKDLDIKEGDTDADGLFTVQKVACLGCCTIAPAVQIDEVTYGFQRPDTTQAMLEDFLSRETARAPRRAGKASNLPLEGEIRLCLVSCCVAAGTAKIREACEETLAVLGCRARIKPVGCVGVCHHTPLVEVIVPGQEPARYARVDPADVPEIIEHHFRPRTPLLRLRAATEKRLRQFYSEDARDVPARYALNLRDAPVVDFSGRQRLLATEHCGIPDPSDFDEYRSMGGFESLETLLKEGDPAALIATIAKAGVRGRGGGGYPTALKWDEVRRAPGDQKVIICNGDEGDPGAFMDRMILESYPWRVIEGMLIASYAVGATEGVLYIRTEYPMTVQRVRHALAVCEEAGLLGDNILGSGHSLNLQLFEGGGAFVCGEETALIASLEGRRGTPRARPPFPSEEGLHGRPTLVNNVETLALLPWILRHGPDAFAALGTRESPGTKVFSLAGKVRRGGLIEVPMGITLRQIIEEIGGGVAGDRTFKAVQIGGPSGGCIPASLADTPVDFEELDKAGAMMGSGGLVVLDDEDCMVEIARYFLAFTQSESCGKCVPCRIGTRRMLEILVRICEGRGKSGDLEALEHLGAVVQAHSLCGLGRTAPNPVLTTLRYFRDEFEAHIAGQCPSGKCTGLIRYHITDDCIGCTRCAVACPVEAIRGTPYSVFEIDLETCIKCGQCRQTCPVNAVKVI